MHADLTICIGQAVPKLSVRPPLQIRAPRRSPGWRNGWRTSPDCRRLVCRLWNLGAGEEGRVRNSWLGPMKRSFSREPYLTLAKRFSLVLGTRHKISVFKVRENEPFGLSLRPLRGLWRWCLAFSRWKWNFRK